jgi:hypothetical protein
MQSLLSNVFTYKKVPTETIGATIEELLETVFHAVREKGSYDEDTSRMSQLSVESKESG